MHLIYMDDSADESGHQVIAAIMVPENHFMAIEAYLAAQVIAKLVPEEMRPTFEFHASKMFHLRDEFSVLNRDQVLQIFKSCISIIAGPPIPVVYGAVNMKSLRKSIYSTAQPTDIAFRLCLEGIREWVDEVKKPGEEIGILICDDTEKTHTKRNMLQSYRAFRRRMQQVVHGHKEPIGLATVIDYLHDDMYFGDSAYSVGIQLADICAFIILRHLQKHEDTEFLYKELEPHILSAKVEPSPIV